MPRHATNDLLLFTTLPKRIDRRLGERFLPYEFATASAERPDVD